MTKADITVLLQGLRVNLTLCSVPEQISDLAETVNALIVVVAALADQLPEES